MTFTALVVDKDAEGATSAALRELDLSDLPEGEVTVAVEYSTLNYKDGLCLGPGGGLVRRYPHVPGVDFAGTVEASSDPRYAPGDIRGFTSRYAPEHIAQNLKLVEVVKDWAARKAASPAQIALAWLLDRKPWIVPIPGTTNMAHMLDNIGADAVRFTPEERAELDKSIAAIEIQGLRLPEGVLVHSGREAPVKR